MEYLKNLIIVISGILVCAACNSTKERPEELGGNFVYYSDVYCNKRKGSCNSAQDCCEKGNSYKKDGEGNCRGCKDDKVEEVQGGNFVYYSDVYCNKRKGSCNSAQDCCEKGNSYKKDGEQDCRGCK